ncbi:MAG: hypothetical protein MJZ98_00510 [Paludibacteraceae bacterium]|nr:hypothetical protein [Paludibacteraceae bacterium]
MKETKYYILTTNPRYGKFAFEEDGIKYYVIWYGNHLPAAMHGAAILGSEVAYKNFD